jgi:hypothetical protein
MKIFSKTATFIIRIMIRKQGEKTQYINIFESTVDEVMNLLKGIIRNQHLSIFEEGRITSVQLRESRDGKNGVSTSFHFKGMSAKDTHDLFMKELTKQTKP